MDLPVSPVFPNTPNGRKQYLHWRQQHRLRSAGRTPPHVAADDPSASTRLEMDDIVDSDDEHNPKEVFLTFQSTPCVLGFTGFYI